ncbi:NAD(P)H-hydrate epimerase [Deinococcus metalli]|uniref:Bifunctional NAD(P)H-hydrate repair enzyme n=1 Tax=Deinococcus metalli TaxID=1141878 RepID=A0A7W8KD84_9DEIO|nr:NAD(P)H-hydrate dehydratase [Deinococcus metalli]MBB5375583.1 NAD(P)H-hydrate epimerase [Deinococcus metalli]GHF28186.1 bifunctional NAD(P)H-hydrate repair enzyme [Deinococcus metalli]
MPQWVLAPEGARRVDARLERAGLLDLAMEEAGRAVADHLLAARPDGPVLLLAGSGANGGDAFVAARHLRVRGVDAAVLALPSRHPLTRANRQRWRAVGGTVTALGAASLARGLRTATMVVDGLLGTGFTPPLRPATAELIATVNAWRGPGRRVLAIDVPSGLDAASALVPEGALRADDTVTLMGYKAALLFGAAAVHAGRVTLAPLSAPPEWVQEDALAARPTDAEVGALLPVRHADAHKGTAGRVWIVGGHPGTTGAPALAGVGALRAGAGLVTVHSTADVPLVTAELMVRRATSWDAWRVETEGASRPDAVALGMGLGPDAAALARTVLAWNIPTVVDADALQPELAGHGHARVIWTPHPGEAARLLGTDTAGIVRDPLGAAHTLQQRFGGVVVLKGGPSVVAHAGGLSVARGGHPGMATAGMGDTLSGILAALLGQGLSAPDAAVAGVRLHARAGERAGARHGYGLIASDVALELGGAWQDVSGGAAGEAW